MDAHDWDRRYSAEEHVWSQEPNALAAELLAPLPPGRALDVGAGEGRMALWLAGRGWQVRAVDFSATGLDKGRRRAEELGVAVEWQVADATAADLGRQEHDLVLALYLQLPSAHLSDVLRRCADAVAPGGTFLALGHDRENLTRGRGGPQDPDVLYDVQLLGAAAAGLDVARLEQVVRATPAGAAVDTLLLARRP